MAAPNYDPERREDRSASTDPAVVPPPLPAGSSDDPVRDRDDADARVRRETDLRNAGVLNEGRTAPTLPGESVRGDKDRGPIVGETADADIDDRDANPDPITGSPGSHPVGTGIGAAAAGAAGAAIGMVAGPVGAAVGAVVGAVAGGLAGKGVAEAIDPTAEDAYWRDEHRRRPYYEAGTDYDEYSPAYQYGYTSYSRYRGRTFDDAEPELRAGWESARGKSRLTWERAKHAVRDAWHRVEERLPGDADRDGR